MMDALITLIAPLEMLFINLFVIGRCSERKYSPAKTYAVMGVFVVALVAPAYYFVSRMPNFGDGSGFFVFWGFLFAIPLWLLYHNSVTKIIALACTSWVYTFILFAISVQISYAVEAVPRSYTVAAVQTLLYMVSFVWFYKKLKYQLFPMLSQLTAREIKSMMWLGIAWFWTVFIINLSLIYTRYTLLRVLAVASFSVCAYSFYAYIYRLVDSYRERESLEHIAYHDDLTQLRTRALLDSDVQQLIQRDIPFALVFIDLNRFKTVNDTYGHAAGDEYLAFFAQETKKIIGNRGGFYRVSGDEFVAVLIDEDTAEFERGIAGFPVTVRDSVVPFLGVSYGIATYPHDAPTLAELLAIADEKMYEMKSKIKADFRRGGG